MIKLRYSDDRGHVDHGWLDTRHSFSFADYYDPQQMGFRSLRVINQDLVKAGNGFPTHPHQDMEIISLVLKGQLQHRDSMGNEGIIHTGEVQMLSAGSGIQHSEWNPSQEENVEFLQIWILPDEKALTPSYQQRILQSKEKEQSWTLLATPNGQNGAFKIHQDVDLWQGRLQQGSENHFVLRAGRYAWIQIIKGDLRVGDRRLHTGDGAAISELSQLEFHSIEGANFLLFDLA